MNFNTIPEALQDLKQGKIILVTDDPDRENEGDFICAAEFATTENINFMATHGKGLICMPMSETFVQKLQFPQMVQHNTDNHETAFTVSIDHVSTSTGISAAERSVTAMACVDDHAKAEDFRRPGHMFPLLAKKNGVLERNGHTEATVDLCRLAGLKECGLCCEIMREDGTMMRTAELMTLAERFGIKFITIRDLQAYRKCHEKLVDQVTAVNLNKLPELNAREGTVSFFFRPNWERKDGKSYYLFQAGKWRSDFFLIFVKDARGQLELSVCTPKQRQLFVKNPDLKAGKWVHITFSWNLAKGEQAIYLDGKPAARKSQADWKEPGYSFNGSWDVWLGKGGSDRFKAEVAEGAFDSLKIYDVQLSDNEVLADFLGSYAKTMRPVPVEQVRRNEGKLEFRFSAPVKRFSNAQPLLSLKSGKSLITVSSTGASGKLTLNGGGKLLDSPYVINLTRPLKLSIRPEGRKAGIWFDDAYSAVPPEQQAKTHSCRLQTSASTRSGKSTAGRPNSPSAHRPDPRGVFQALRRLSVSAKRIPFPKTPERKA